MEDLLLANTRSLFRDEALAGSYHRQGFVIIPDFINQKEIEDLRTLHRQNAPRLNMAEKSIYSNFEENPMKVNLAIEDAIYQAFSASIRKYFRDYRIYGGSFLIKGYGGTTKTDIHQDWIAVNEEQYPAFSIWVPLQDVDERSGCLIAVPGSHRWASTIRSVNFPSVYVPLDRIAEKHMRKLSIKAGCAVVYGMNTFHGSMPNLQGKERAAVHLVLTNREASLIHFLHEPDKKQMAVVECSRDFMYDYIFDIQKGKYPPSMRVLGYIEDTGHWRMTEAQWQSFAEAELRNSI
jgi:hypothetical protein